MMQDMVKVKCAVVGVEFQINSAQTLKARWPVDLRTRGCSNRNWSDDSNKRGGTDGLINEFRFSGLFSDKSLKTINEIMNFILD